MLWRVMATRFHRRSSWIAALMITALGTVVFAAVSFTLQAHAANQQIRAEEHQRAAAGDSVLPSAMPFRVTAYDVVFALDDPAQLSAQIEVVNRSDAPLTELTFSLYHQFEIVEASVLVTHDGDTVTLTLPAPLAPGDSTSVSIAYAGSITYFERRLGRPPEATYFIRPEGVYLSCAVLWYPVPGRLFPNVTEYNEQFAAQHTCLLDQPAAFRLTVDDPGALRFASNLTALNPTSFASDGTTWVQLIGNDSIQVTTDGSLTLVTTAAEANDVRHRAEQYVIPPYEYIQRFFPDAPNLTVVAMGLASDSFTQWQAHPATRESLYLFIDPRRFDFIDTGAQNVYMDVGAPLIKSLFGGQDNGLTENIAYFLWVHYLTGGDTEAMRPLLEQGLPAGSTSSHSSISFEERYQIANMLYDVYFSTGETATFDLLRAMRTQFDGVSVLSVEELDAWIAETLHGD